jgi:hypothetical protein
LELWRAAWPKPLLQLPLNILLWVAAVEEIQILGQAVEPAVIEQILV